jgi:uncharacterized membrane-anchored protein
MSTRDRSQLLRELKAAFPALVSSLNAQRGLLHFEVDVFRRYTQQAIDGDDRDAVARCLVMAATYLAEGNTAVRNAMDVSFVAPLSFGSGRDLRRWAWDAMPAGLKAAYVAFHGHPPG